MTHATESRRWRVAISERFRGIDGRAWTNRYTLRYEMSRRQLLRRLRQLRQFRRRYTGGTCTYIIKKAHRKSHQTRHKKWK